MAKTNSSDQVKMRGGLMRRSILSAQPLFETVRREQQDADRGNLADALREEAREREQETNGYCNCCARPVVLLTDSELNESICSLCRSYDVSRNVGQLASVMDREF